MKKRCIVLFLAILYVFIGILKPVRVNALEEESLNVNEIIENDSTKYVDSSLEENIDEKKEPVETKEVETEEKESVETKEVETEENEPNVSNITNDDTNEDIHGGQIYDIQKVKVIVTKFVKDDSGKKIPLAGALLQIKDSSGKVIDEWTSDGTDHVIELPDGTYILHEEKAPEGYDLAADEEFTVKVEIAELDAGSDASATPCPHYTGTQMYYVEIEGKKNEVYCINQNWETPDADSQYNGEILNSGSIRDYTKQTIPVDVDPTVPDEDGHANAGIILSDGPVDVSDPNLTDDELYNKILDIIYHRHIAASHLEDEYTTEEIRFITEVALKNYTNAILAERQYNVKATEALLAAFDDAGVVYKTYSCTNYGTCVSYIKHNYRDFVYTPDVPLGQDIVKTDYGKGNSFGQMVAGHWNNFSSNRYLHPEADPATQAHNAKNKQEDRDTVARFYRLFEFLISNDNPHPSDMNLYIYSSNTTPTDLSNNNFDAKYQNLLGVTGYFEEVKQQEKIVELENTYSTEEVSVTVKKVWDDANNQDGKRPESINVTLSNGQEFELNEENDWTVTVNNLPKYNKGKLIEYTWSEKDLPDGYTLTNTESKDYITTLTNSYTPEVVSFKVLKIWHDENDEQKKRPENVTVSLSINDDEVYETITLSEENGWEYEFTDLPAYREGQKLIYTVREENIPEGYVESYEGDMEKGFVIYNGLGQGGDNPPPKNPQTGDNITLYFAILFVSSIIFVIGRKYLKNND